MNSVSALATLIPKACVRRLSVTQVRSCKTDISKIKRKQIHYQEDNNVPVYVKGGSMDYVLFYSTVALVFIGVSASAHSAYKLANK